MRNYCKQVLSSLFNSPSWASKVHGACKAESPLDYQTLLISNKIEKAPAWCYKVSLEYGSTLSSAVYGNAE